jgi:hypothetical protein
MKKIAIAFFLIIIFFSDLYSQEIPYGQEFQVNTYTDNSQKQWGFCCVLDK